MHISMLLSNINHNWEVVGEKRAKKAIVYLYLRENLRQNEKTRG